MIGFALSSAWGRGSSASCCKGNLQRRKSSCTGATWAVMNCCVLDFDLGWRKSSCTGATWAVTNCWVLDFHLGWRWGRIRIFPYRTRKWSDLFAWGYSVIRKRRSFGIIEWKDALTRSVMRRLTMGGQKKFWEMRRQAISLLCQRHRVYLHKPR